MEAKVMGIETIPEKERISANGKAVLERRYLRKGSDGSPIETIDEMFWRVAYNIALPKDEWGGDIDQVAVLFYELLTSRRFLPNSPTFTGAGTPLGQLAACFVLPIADDMGRHSAGILPTRCTSTPASCSRGMVVSWTAPSARGSGSR